MLPGITAGTVAMGAALVAAGVGMVALSKKAIFAAGDVEEIGSKFDAVFKDSAGGAREWADEFSDSVGRSVYDVQKQLSQFQDTFVPLGFSRKDGAEMSKVLTELTADIASFNNEQDEVAAAALQSALVGNHETMRKYGVIITQTTLDQELLNMGTEKGIQGATEQQKVQARLNMILAGTSDAQGDATRTAGSFANMLRNIKGDMADMMAESGKDGVDNLTDTFIKFDEWGEAGGYDRMGDFMSGVATHAADFADVVAQAGMDLADSIDATESQLEDLERKEAEFNARSAQNMLAFSADNNLPSIFDDFIKAGLSDVEMALVLGKSYEEVMQNLTKDAEEQADAAEDHKDIVDDQNDAYDKQLEKVQAIKNELKDANSSIPDWAGHSDYIKGRFEDMGVDKGKYGENGEYISNPDYNISSMLDMIEKDPTRFLNGTSREGELGQVEVTQTISQDITVNIEHVSTTSTGGLGNYVSDEMRLSMSSIGEPPTAPRR